MDKVRLVRWGTAAATALVSGGYVAGEADFGPVITRQHEVTLVRQIQTGQPGCTRLDNLDAATGSTGMVQAIRSPEPAIWCWQVNGRQIVTGSPHCQRLDDAAAALTALGKQRDTYDYLPDRLEAIRLTDPEVCWQVGVSMQVAMSCTPE